jgi:uncharacterized membrane protein YeaQ/YmgE (transglycosylase-associated protein family)
MHLSNESIIAILVVGIVAGWLAGVLVQGSGFGLIGDLAVGIIGAFVGDWVLPHLHVYLGSGWVAAIANAAIGAVILLIILRLIFGLGRSGWRRRY